MQNLWKGNPKQNLFNWIEQELKELRKQQRIAYKYKADNALATGDCARRAREVTLKKAQEDNMKLKSDTE